MLIADYIAISGLIVLALLWAFFEASGLFSRLQFDLNQGTLSNLRSRFS